VSKNHLHKITIHIAYEPSYSSVCFYLLVDVILSHYRYRLKVLISICINDFFTNHATTGRLTIASPRMKWYIVIKPGASDVYTALKPRSVIVESVVNLMNMFRCVLLNPPGGGDKNPDKVVIEGALPLFPSRSSTKSQHDSVLKNSKCSVTICNINNINK